MKGNNKFMRIVSAFLALALTITTVLAGNVTVASARESQPQQPQQVTTYNHIAVSQQTKNADKTESEWYLKGAPTLYQYVSTTTYSCGKQESGGPYGHRHGAQCNPTTTSDYTKVISLIGGSSNNNGYEYQSTMSYRFTSSDKFKLVGTVSNGSRTESVTIYISDTSNYQDSGYSFYQYCYRYYCDKTGGNNGIDMKISIEDLIKSFGVSYSVDGDLFTVVDNSYYGNGDTATVKAAPAKTGYTFTGWTVEGDNSGTLYQEGNSYTVNGSVTFVANYTKNTYSVNVTYVDENDDKITTSGYSAIKYGDTVKIATPDTITPDTTAVKSETYYYTKNDSTYTGTTYEVTVTGDVDLTVHYTTDKVTVTFKDHDDKSVSEQEINKGANGSALTEVSGLASYVEDLRTYEFVSKWTLGDDTDYNVYGSSTVYTENTTLVANYATNICLVTVNYLSKDEQNEDGSAKVLDTAEVVAVEKNGAYTATAKSIEGYKADADNTLTISNIAEDATINVYYNKLYTVTYVKVQDSETSTVATYTDIKGTELTDIPSLKDFVGGIYNYKTNGYVLTDGTALVNNTIQGDATYTAVCVKKIVVTYYEYYAAVDEAGDFRDLKDTKANHYTELGSAVFSEDPAEGEYELTQAVIEAFTAAYNSKKVTYDTEQIEGICDVSEDKALTEDTERPDVWYDAKLYTTCWHVDGGDLNEYTFTVNYLDSADEETALQDAKVIEGLNVGDTVEVKIPESITLENGVTYLLDEDAEIGDGMYVTKYDKTVTVKNVYYTEQPFTVTFLKDNGNEYQTAKAYYGSAVVAPTSNPSYTGSKNIYTYVFAGWDLGVENEEGNLVFDGETDELEESVSGDLTYKAVFVKTIKVTYYKVINPASVDVVSDFYDQDADEGIISRSSNKFTQFGTVSVTEEDDLFAELETLLKKIYSYKVSGKKPGADYTNHYDDLQAVINLTSSVANQKDAADVWYVLKLESDGWHIDGGDLNDYTVSFYNGEELLQSGSYNVGNEVTYEGDVTELLPADADTNTYDYEFIGWADENDKLVEDLTCTGDAAYYAVFEAEEIPYTVTFYDEDGKTVLYEQTSKYGTELNVPADPEKEATNEYTYSFAGWDHEVSETITANDSYIAKYDYEEVTYSVIFRNEDGTTISGRTNYTFEEEVEVPENPTKAQDDTYTYNFIGWDTDGDGEVDVTEIPAEVTEDVVYTAVFEAVYRTYTVTFLDEDGTVLASKTDYHFGDDVVIPADPSKAATEAVTYSFDGWNYEVITKVAGNATYTATYEATPIPEVEADEEVAENTTEKTGEVEADEEVVEDTTEKSGEDTTETPTKKSEVEADTDVTTADFADYGLLISLLCASVIALGTVAMKRRNSKKEA